MCEIINDETIVQRSIVHMGGGDVAVVRRWTRQKIEGSIPRGNY